MKQLTKDFKKYRVADFNGRYLDPDMVEQYLLSLPPDMHLEVAGHSVRNRKIYRLSLGTGKTKVLMWSQMHGNETTTTKAVLDLINYFILEKPAIGAHLNLVIFPVLNPDGAAAYLRENANGVDLNRDAIALSQPESKVLNQAFKQLKPDFSFNLHDQRTLYNVGRSPKPATLSFLAPAKDAQKSVPPHREKAMQLIAHLVRTLSAELPGQIGRYSDDFNPNCVGDRFTGLGSSTLLFEAGHFPGDYQREHTRYFVFKALVAALYAIVNKGYSPYSVDDYVKIPENGKQFMDIIIRNVPAEDTAGHMLRTLGIRFKEQLRDGAVVFMPEVEEVGTLEGYYGHLTLDWARPEDRKKIREYPELLKRIPGA